MSTQQQSKDLERRPVHMSMEWNSVRAMFAAPRYQEALERAARLTRNPVVLPDDAVKAVLAAVLDNPGLAQVHEMSLLYGALMSIRTGLPVGKPLDLAYLVPRKNEAVKCQWAYFTPSYMGQCTVAYREPKVKLIGAESVHEKDEFRMEHGPWPKVHHIYGEPRGERLVGSYAWVWMKGAPQPFLVSFTEEDIEKRRKMSKSRLYSDGTPNPNNPWNKWPDEMVKGKTVRALSKFIPRSPEMGFLAQAEDHFDDDANDERMVWHLENDLATEILPAATSVSVDVTDRMAERAAVVASPGNKLTEDEGFADVDEGPAARREANQRAGVIDPADHGSVSEFGEEFLYIGEHEARVLLAKALDALGSTAVDAWVEEVLARCGVDSLQFLSPGDAAREAARLRTN